MVYTLGREALHVGTCCAKCRYVCDSVSVLFSVTLLSFFGIRTRAAVFAPAACMSTVFLQRLYGKECGYTYYYKYDYSCCVHDLSYNAFHDEGTCPCDDTLQNHYESCPFGAEFSTYGGYGSNARSVEKTEYEECIA